MNTREQWRQVPGFPDYEVSNLGRVMRPLRLQVGSRGYVTAKLVNGKRTWQGVVHRLVLSAFRGGAPSPDFVVNHINGIKTDNRLENLEWVSVGDNQRHAYRVLGRAPGNKSKLTAQDIPRIREMYATGNVTIKGLATLFRTHTHRIAGILGEDRRKGGNQPGSISPRRAFTAEQELDICRRIEQGEMVTALAKEFGVSQPCLSRVLRRHGINDGRTRRRLRLNRRLLSVERETELAQRFRAGESSWELAAAFKIGRSAVYRIAKRTTPTS